MSHTAPVDTAPTRFIGECQTYACGKLHKPVSLLKFGHALAVQHAISGAVNELLKKITRP